MPQLDFLHDEVLEGSRPTSTLFHEPIILKTIICFLDKTGKKGKKKKKKHNKDFIKSH